jgi:type IV pilus assembly protein PilV
MSIRKQSGFTLIEVLIAVVIFGVGLLTVASLQIVARQANYDAVQRTTATHLAQGMLERMRANRPALGTYTSGGERVLGNNSLGGDDGSCRARNAPCDAAAMAVADLREWEQLLDGSYEVADGAGVGGLVSPTACIRGSGGTGAYAVAIAWRSANEQTVAPADNCGAGNAAYGASDEFRRVVTVRTFINTP